MTKTAVAADEPRRPQRTNGDRIQPVVDRMKKVLVEGARQAREHPDEAVVAVVPMVFALHFSIKYDMSVIDHVLVTQVGQQLGFLALRAYREWKTRPAAGRSLREVV